MKSKEKAWTCNVLASDFRIGIKWPQIGLREGGDVKHIYPVHIIDLWPFKCREKPWRYFAIDWVDNKCASDGN